MSPMIVFGSILILVFFLNHLRHNATVDHKLCIFMYTMPIKILYYPGTFLHAYHTRIVLLHIYSNQILYIKKQSNWIFNQYHILTWALIEPILDYVNKM